MNHHLHPRRLATVAAAAATAGLLTIAGSALAATVGVNIGNYYFEDATVGDGKVTATVGDQLRFTVVQGAGHTVTISALGIDSGQLPNGDVYVTPVLTTPGTYSLVCRTHLARGHQTTLVVLAGSGGGGGGGATTTTRPPTTTAPGSTTTIPGDSVPDSTTGGGSSAGAPPTSVGGATIPGGSTVDGDGDGTVDSGDATGTSVEGELAVGVTVSDGTPWLRGVWVALVALPLFAAVGTVADELARRRHSTAAHASNDATPTDLEHP